VFVLGHLGLGLGLAWLVTSWRGRPIDFRLVLVGAVLPDVIDKPLGAILGLESRLWAHTLWFLAGFLLLGVLPPLRGLQWVGFGVASHLLLDLIWGQPNVVLWPFAGPFLPGTMSLGGFLHVLLTDPYVQVGEILGTAVLFLFVWTFRLGSWSALGRFLRRGELPGRGGAA
jgi:hypothetical protein